MFSQIKYKKRLMLHHFYCNVGKTALLFYHFFLGTQTKNMAANCCIDNFWQELVDEKDNHMMMLSHQQGNPRLAFRSSKSYPRQSFGLDLDNLKTTLRYPCWCLNTINEQSFYDPVQIWTSEREICKYCIIFFRNSISNEN